MKIVKGKDVQPTQVACSSMVNGHVYQNTQSGHFWVCYVGHGELKSVWVNLTLSKHYTLKGMHLDSLFVKVEAELHVN